jgi:hypothetical protein
MSYLHVFNNTRMLSAAASSGGGGRLFAQSCVILCMVDPGFGAESLTQAAYWKTYEMEILAPSKFDILESNYSPVALQASLK